MKGDTIGPALDDPRPGFWEFHYFPAGQHGNITRPRDRWGMHANCPCGCADTMFIDVHPMEIWDSAGARPGWLWQGGEERPTLSPSIRRLFACKFHGFLQNGVWSSAGDGAPLAANCYKAGDPPALTTPETHMTTPKADPSKNISSPPPADKSPGNPRPLAAILKRSVAPIGYAGQAVFHFFGGVLHQLHTAVLPTNGTTDAWVPISGQEKDADPVVAPSRVNPEDQHSQARQAMPSPHGGPVVDPNAHIVRPEDRHPAQPAATVYSGAGGQPVQQPPVAAATATSGLPPHEQPTPGMAPQVPGAPPVPPQVHPTP